MDNLPKRALASIGKNVVNRTIDVEKLQKEHAMFKAQLAAISDQEICYVAHCQAVDANTEPICDFWLVQSIHDNNDESLSYCDTCTWDFCPDHMHSETQCTGCATGSYDQHTN